MTGAVLDRLATAIRDSATETPADPGVRACGPSGRNLWCAGDLDGARLTDNWRAFRAWSPTTSAFVSTPPSVVAGAVSGAITRAGAGRRRPGAAGGPVVTTFSSSSPTGTFSTSATGPSTPTVASRSRAARSGRRRSSTRTTTGIADDHGVRRRRRRGDPSLAVTGAAPISIRLDPVGDGDDRARRRRSTRSGATSSGTSSRSRRRGRSRPDARHGDARDRPDRDLHGGAAPGTGTGHRDDRDADRHGSRRRPRSRSRHRPSSAWRRSATASQTAGLHVYVTVVNAAGRRVNDASVTVALYREGRSTPAAAGGPGRPDDVRPAGVDRHVPHEGHPGRRDGSRLGSRHAREQLHEAPAARTLIGGTGSGRNRRPNSGTPDGGERSGSRRRPRAGTRVHVRGARNQAGPGSATGEARVFVPNPVEDLGNQGLTDQKDADYAALQPRTGRRLTNLDGSGPAGTGP